VVHGVDLDALRPFIETQVLEMRHALEGDLEERRDAFRAPLGDRKMCVFPDPERRFRVDGIFELALETTDARDPEGRRASAMSGSGGGATPETRRAARAVAPARCGARGGWV
jgi:hypothetical protein